MADKQKIFSLAVLVQLLIIGLLGFAFHFCECGFHWAANFGCRHEEHVEHSHPCKECSETFANSHCHGCYSSSALSLFTEPPQWHMCSGSSVSYMWTNSVLFQSLPILHSPSHQIIPAYLRNCTFLL